MNKLFSVLLLGFLAISFSVDVPEEDGVLVLSSDIFEQVLAETEHILVEFYAPWCGHCKKLAPEYAKAAQALKNENSPIKLAKVDATQESSLAGRFDVRGYPTLKFFINGNPIPYEGGRTESEIISWLKKKTQPSSKDISSLEEFDALIAANDVVVTFWGDKTHDHYGTFEIVSKGVEDVVFVTASAEDIKQKHNVDHDDVITLFKRFDEGVVDFEGDLSADLLLNFIKEHQYPTVMGFDQKIAQKIFSESTPALFLIHRHDEAGQRAAEAFRTIAPKLKGKTYLSISNIDEGLGGKLAEFVGVTRDHLPAIRLLHPLPGGNPKKYLFQEEITPENIYGFFEDFSSGKLKAYLKSEDVPENNDAPVKVVVGHNFDEIVLDEESDVLVEFYAPWCGHCKQLAPHYEEAAKKLSHVKKLVIAKVDATANEIEGVHIQSYPTIKFYPAHEKKTPVDFDGDRNTDGIISWLKTHAKNAAWGSEDL